MCLSWPNPTVKGMRRPKAVLTVGFLIGFGGFAWRPERRAPYLCVGQLRRLTMHKLIVTILLSILFCTSANANTVGLDSTKVDESFDFQNTPVWCWAATIQMALRYYGFDIKQPEIVQRTFGAAIPTTGNWVQMTQNLNYLGQAPNGKNMLVSATVYFGSPSAESIINHLKQKKPIIMAFNNPRTFSGHAILVTAVDYHFAGKRAVIDQLTIRDPFPYNPQHITAKGKVIIPNGITTPTNIWLVDATEE